MLSSLFIVFTVATAIAVVAVMAQYFRGRVAVAAAAALLAWFAYVGLIGVFGIVRNSATRPPGIVFLAVPVVVLLIVFIVRTANGRLAAAIPLWLLFGLQVFRVGVEVFLHAMWIAGIVPKMLTFSGANVDIYIGATAPLVAWLSMRGRVGFRVALIWNGLGLLALANVVVRSVLTTAGPLNLVHAEVPNRMMGTFPYLFIPGFFVPLAVMLHVLSIESILERLRSRRASLA